MSESPTGWIGCPCCAGSTQFDWFMEACDPCAEAIVAGCWGHDDLHPLSDEQKAALAGEPT